MFSLPCFPLFPQFIVATHYQRLVNLTCLHPVRK